jgi:uncharacterized protein
MDPVDVRDLLGQPGSSRQVQVADRIEGLATELAEVPSPVRVDVLLESVVEGILVSVQVTELFAPAPAEEDDAYPLREGTIDLEPMVRDAVVLSMPFSPLCRHDCLGLCERCGGDRNLGECTCPPATDPRWAALEGLELE